MEMQNSWESVINEKQKQIDAFVQNTLDNLIERVERTSDGTSDDYMIHFDEKEYDKVIGILTEVYTECPIMKHIKEALNKPDYIWDSYFIENLSREEKHKWNFNPLKGDFKEFNHNNKVYDEKHPYFSYIYKVVLYERYIAFLLDDKKKHEILLEMNKDMQRGKETDPKPNTNNKPSLKKETNVAYLKGSPQETSSNLPTFEHTLSENQMVHLTSIINELHIFREADITTEQLKSIFSCSPTVILKSKNNRLLAHLFDQLSRREYITENWQAVIARNKLFKSSQKDDFLNQNDLSTATNKLLTMEKHEKYNKLEVLIKNLKEH